MIVLIFKMQSFLFSNDSSCKKIVTLIKVARSKRLLLLADSQAAIKAFGSYVISSKILRDFGKKKKPSIWVPGTDERKETK